MFFKKKDTAMLWRDQGGRMDEEGGAEEGWSPRMGFVEEGKPSGGKAPGWGSPGTGS